MAFGNLINSKSVGQAFDGDVPWPWFVIGSIPLLGYLLTASFDLEFFFFLGVLIIVVFVVGLLNFEAALIFVPLVLTNPYTLRETQTNLHISEVVLLVIFLVWFLRWISGSRRYVFPKEFLLSSIVIILAAVASLSVARYPLAGILQIVRYVEVLIFFFLIIYNHCTSKEDIRRMFGLLLIGGLLASLVGLVQFVTGDMTVSGTRRIFGWHGGGYGALIGSTLLLAISTLMFDRDKVLRMWASIALPFAALALILSQTRAWLAAFLLAVFLVFVWSRRQMIGRLLFVGGVVLVSLVIVIQTNMFGLVDNSLLRAALENAFRLSTEAGRLSDLSLLLRLMVWGFSVGLFLSNPLLGIGVGGLRFADYYTLRLGRPEEGVGYVDNQYIQFFAEAGFAAGIGWVVFVYFALRRGIQSLRLSKGTSLQAVATGLLGSLLIFVIGSCFWVITPHHDLFAIMIMNIALLLNVSIVLQNTDQRVT